ncbi:MAG: DUF2231 domain-containing protein [Actinomycetota bacterium]|nr:DUF2231 domain-containing protein [Actinomycetota bacterium]
MPKLFSIKPGVTIRGRKFKGLRGWAGKPAHPPLTDIPVACYVIFPIFDLISLAVEDGSATSRNFFDAATYVAIAGLIVSVPTALTGFWDWLKSTPKHTQAWRTANWHMAVMLTVTLLVVVNLLVRNNEDWSTLPLTVLSLVTAGLVTFGASYGGSLVYDYGFNVETSGDHPVWHESEEDVLPGQH